MRYDVFETMQSVLEPGAANRTFSTHFSRAKGHTIVRDQGIVTIEKDGARVEVPIGNMKYGVPAEEQDVKRGPGRPPKEHAA